MEEIQDLRALPSPQSGEEDNTDRSATSRFRLSNQDLTLLYPIFSLP